jgi:hypothetical protein
LGSGRYFRRGGRRGYTDTNADCYSDSDRYSNGQRDCHTDGDSDRYGNGQPNGNSIDNSHAATDANTEVGAIRKAAPHASAEAIDFSRRKTSGDR